MNINRLIASIPSLDPTARVKMRANAAKLLESGKGDDKANAQMALDALDACEAQEIEQQVKYASTLPRAQLVIDAFRANPMTETEKKIVQALLDNPGLSSEALSEKVGWGGQTWHMHFGTMCKNRMARLWPAPHAEKRDVDFYSGILADISDGTNVWTMKPEAVEAFAALGVCPKAKPPSLS